MMSLRYVLPLVFLSTGGFAGEPSRAPVDIGWSYYGLNGGGARIVRHGKDFRYGTPITLNIGTGRCAPGIALYDPPTPTFGPTCAASLAKDPPRNLFLGWVTYRTPSPRGGTSVGVWP
jgi:hypothetical protein